MGTEEVYPEMYSERKSGILVTQDGFIDFSGLGVQERCLGFIWWLIVVKRKPRPMSRNTD